MRPGRPDKSTILKKTMRMDQRLLFLLDGDPATYQEFAQEYYECSIDLEAVSSIYQHQPLTAEIIKALNPEVSLESLSSDLEEIAYGRGAI